MNGSESEHESEHGNGNTRPAITQDQIRLGSAQDEPARRSLGTGQEEQHRPGTGDQGERGQGLRLPSPAAAGGAVREGVVGLVRGVGDVETEVVGLLQRTVSDTVRATGAVANDTIAVTQEVLTGALHGVGHVGGEAGLLARHALDGTLETVGEVGTTAVGSIRGILVQAAGGIKDVLSALLPQPRRTAAE